MRITKLQLKNFKRFTDLTIAGIPAEAKLVLLIGSNGSGKSSVFDGLDYVRQRITIDKNFVLIDDIHEPYYSKGALNPEVDIEFSDGNRVGTLETKFGKGGRDFNKKLIGRSSIRIVPRIINSGDITSPKSNADAPKSFIDMDDRFVNDLSTYIQQIDNALREPVFSGRSADTFKIFQDFIQPLNASLINILGGDVSTTIQIAEYQNATPQSNGTLIFKKGDSKISYDLLSHGEKQIVILLLNFIVRKEYYKDAIIYIDEMDCHLNTSLQSSLLAEIVNVWIPDDAQLWTASHALGFIDFARSAENAAIVDLDLLNFDIPQMILPEPKENMEVYDIAVPKETMKNILKGYKLVVAENQNDKHYNLALNEKGYFFLPAQNSREVFLTIKGDTAKLGLRDRDYLREDEIARIRAKYPNLKILQYYAFENYIYHPDNIAELRWHGYNKDAYIKEIIVQKKKSFIQIVSKIAVARQSYVEFKEGIKNDENIAPILQDLESDDFESFYPFFSVKDYYNKAYLQQFKYTISDLVKTNWFKSNIARLLNDPA
ncbi:AAA family ATPase [Chitinophaga sp. YIM B06452]|uniref:AAA family ATPase n=1 Tax=Chitinophaga sp. YIM B06452 TaxID=3082158 RepID=UPI0031FE6706